MEGSKEKCSCCPNLGDQKEIRRVKSQSLILNLNKIFPNVSIIAGMPVCVVCCSLAHRFSEPELDIGNIYLLFISN